MRYLVLIHVDENVGGEPPAELMDAMSAHVADERHAKLVTDAGLMPTSAATRVASRGGDVLTTDGPFAETKEVVGGFMLIEAPTHDDALAWTRGFVGLHAEHWPELEVVTELRQVAGSLSEG
ncbi:YciI family protein [Aeromicrobium sp. NPDC092404]|uniref:YciI family protein n=1 Tax=Aeromicrobium sp. NPDC092404 TaxID=3154976 RepID=UPI00342F6641